MSATVVITGAFSYTGKYATLFGPWIRGPHAHQPSSDKPSGAAEPFRRPREGLSV